MPKRKRSGASPAATDNNDANPALARQRSKLLPLLDRSKKTLIKTLKLARGFERQKLSRRLKTAQTANDAATAERVGREIEALKALRFERLAEVGLGRQLGRVKRVREHEAVPPWVLRAGMKGAAGEERKEVLDLQARLFNARATRVAMDKIVEDVRECLGVVGEEKGGVKEKKAKMEKKSAKTTRKQEEEEEFDSESEEAEGRDGQGDAAGDDFDSEDEFAGFSDRIAASSDEEEDDELRVPPGYKPTRDLSVTPDPSPAASEDEQDEDEALASADGSNDENDDDEQQASDASLLEEESEEEEEEEEQEQEDTAMASPSRSASPEAPSKPSRTAAIAAAAAPTKSTFIPSLSAVGYISGSDSDGPEPEDVDEAVAPRRKNRRGQRARQAIWEKKYGEKAAHVQKQQQQQQQQQHKAKTDRNAGWDAKRGATDGAARGKGAKGGVKFGGAGARGGPKGKGKDSGTAANTTALGKRKVPAHRDDEGKLHPSWEAKKRLKEQASAKVQFLGKKITFD
ncbi:Bud-site selection protein [Phyllosticta citricarpa]|uniref:Bud-site selection protein n=1 Tax=Phyllosticta citricarpa TaxID=55181 RepID=A0ABR1MCQ0_9PEZI